MARRLWTTRAGVAALMALLIAVGVALYVTWTGMAARRPVIVRYGARVIEPLDGTLCPGDALRYPVSLTVSADDLPAITEVVEGWYSVAAGVVLWSTITTARVPLVRPSSVNATATRVVPDLPAGEYWLDHVSHNGRYDAYTVGPVQVGACGR